MVRIEEKKSLKQAFFFVFLTILLIIFLIFIGIPFLIKMVAFLGDIHSSKQKVEMEDSIIPMTPIIDLPFEATKSAKINLSGFTEQGLQVKLIVNKEIVQEAIADKNGAFLFSNISLHSGENKIKVQAISLSGKKSSLSLEKSVIFDDQAPELEIIFPKDKDKFFDKDKQINIKGKTEADVNVYANGRFSAADSNGDFSVGLNLKEGENKIQVKVKDKAGNEATKEITVTYIP